MRTLRRNVKLFSNDGGGVSLDLCPRLPTVHVSAAALILSLEKSHFWGLIASFLEKTIAAAKCDASSLIWVIFFSPSCFWSAARAPNMFSVLNQQWFWVSWCHSKSRGTRGMATLTTGFLWDQWLGEKDWSIDPSIDGDCISFAIITMTIEHAWALYSIPFLNTVYSVPPNTNTNIKVAKKQNKTRPIKSPPHDSTIWNIHLQQFHLVRFV